MGGFFSTSELIAPEPTSGISRCGSCGLHRSCKSPRMPVTGRGERGVLIVAEAPGESEDREGVQLIGKSGQRLRRELKSLGWDLDRDCWKTNALICKPGEDKPTDGQVEACRPNLLRTIEDLKPETVVLLGGYAVQSLIGLLWRKDVGPIGRWAGWKVPCRRWNCWICPTWHPSYLLRESDPVLDLWFDRHLEAALARQGRPWPEGVSSLPEAVEAVCEPARAARIVLEMARRGGRVAFDYETDRLKPDHPDARIVSCGICWEGRKTIAFPWHGDAIEATGGLLFDPRVKKIGWNAKFEERWTVAKFGRGVSGWEWDGMQAIHVLDNRPGITSCKFQAFTQLGQEPWDLEVGPYLEGVGGNGKNKIDRVDLGDLLRYNGTDALVEFLLAERQMKEMGL